MFINTCLSVYPTTRLSVAASCSSSDGHYVVQNMYSPLAWVILHVMSKRLRGFQYIYINMHSEACSKAPSQELLHRSLSRDQESLCSTQSMSNLQPKPGCNENPCHTAGDHQYPSIHVNQCSLILVDLDRLQPPPPDCTAEHLVPKSATLRGSVIETRNGRERSWLNPTAVDDTCFLMQYM